MFKNWQKIHHTPHRNLDRQRTCQEAMDPVKKKKRRTINFPTYMSFIHFSQLHCIPTISLSFTCSLFRFHFFFRLFLRRLLFFFSLFRFSIVLVFFRCFFLPSFLSSFSLFSSLLSLFPFRYFLLFPFTSFLFFLSFFLSYFPSFLFSFFIPSSRRLRHYFTKWHASSLPYPSDFSGFSVSSKASI